MESNSDSPSSSMSLAKQAKTFFGATFLMVLAVALLYAAVALWPPAFLNTAFGQMTLNMFFQFAGAFGLFVIGISVFVFSSSTFYSLSSSAQEAPFVAWIIVFVFKVVIWIIILALLWYMAKFFAK